MGKISEYKKKRELVIKRYEGNCFSCGLPREKHFQKYGRDITIHHLDGKGDRHPYPNHNTDNLIPLCEDCHHQLHGEQKEQTMHSYSCLPPRFVKKPPNKPSPMVNLPGA